MKSKGEQPSILLLISIKKQPASCGLFYFDKLVFELLG